MAEQFRPGIDLNKAEEAVRSLVQHGIEHNVFTSPDTTGPLLLTESFRTHKSTATYYQYLTKKEPK